MVNKTRLIFVTITAFCLLPRPVFAGGKISLRLQGGWTSISAGDVNPGTQNWLYYNKAAWPAWNGGFQSVHNGYEIGGDLIFELTPRLGVGVGGGYMQISRASSMGFFFIEPSLPMGYAVAEPRLSAVPIRMGVYLTLPLCRKLNFLADGGLSCYFRARYSDELRASTWTGAILTSYKIITTRAENKKPPFGLQGGLGLEYEMLHDIFLFLNARGRYARFDGWKGTSELEIWQIGDEDATTYSEQGFLYYEYVPALPNPPRLITVQRSPSLTSGLQPRKAVIDFSGVSLQFGIRIRLF
jgi:hypothetical protein